MSHSAADAGDEIEVFVRVQHDQPGEFGTSPCRPAPRGAGRRVQVPGRAAGLAVMKLTSPVCGRHHVQSTCIAYMTLDPHAHERRKMSTDFGAVTWTPPRTWGSGPGGPGAGRSEERSPNTSGGSPRSCDG